MTRLALPVLLVAAAACTDDGPTPSAPVTEPAPTLPATPATDADDGCNEEAFRGTFDLPKPRHEGDAPLCEARAEALDETDKAHVLVVERDGKGFWVRTDSGKERSPYELDAKTCTLTGVASVDGEVIGDDGSPATITIAATTTLSLTEAGVRWQRTDLYQADDASNVSGFPCSISSTTDGVRR